MSVARRDVGFRSERGPILIALMLTTGLVAIESTILATAVPSIVKDIGTVWEQRTHHIAESLAVGFYPFAVATPALLDATQTWLDEHPDASSSLRRTMSENRDSVARALRAQAADATAP